MIVLYAMIKLYDLSFDTHHAENITHGISLVPLITQTIPVLSSTKIKFSL